MNRLAITSVLAALMFAAIAPGCTDDGGGADPVVRGCQRLDECNALGAGVSVDECVEEIDAQLDDLGASQREDWNGLMRGCLNFNTCQLFLDCVVDSGL